MKGTRVYDRMPTGSGEYGKIEGGWYATPPATKLFANISGHKIEEHEDGTITVSPSILVSCVRVTDTPEQAKANTWHGYLEKGVWREV